MLIGAINAENGEANKVKNLLNGSYGAVPDVARDYKKNGVPWVVVGGEHFFDTLLASRANWDKIGIMARALLVSTLRLSPGTWVALPSSPAPSLVSTRPT